MIPNLFYKESIPKKIPKDMEAIISDLKKSKSKIDCLKKAYEVVSKRYQGYRIKTYTHFFEMFADLDELWARSGFLHCHNMNYILRALLVKSGFFKDSDMELKLTLVWFISLHQYLRIKIDNGKYIEVDIWGKTHGIKFNDHIHGFY